MSQGTRVHLNTRKFIIGMSNVRRTEFRKFLDHILDIQKSLSGKNRIIGFHRMTFAQDEPVSVRAILIFRSHIHLAEIQTHKDFHNAHVSADMAALSFHDHIHNIFS